MTKLTGSSLLSGDSNALNFTLFVSYSDFILENHLDAFVENIIQKSRESDLRILKLLKKSSEEEIFKLFKTWLTKDLLIPVRENRPFAKVYQNIKDWKENKTIVSKDHYKITEVISFYMVMKRGLIHFIQFYDYPIDINFDLVDEIELYFERCIELGLKAFEEIKSESLIDRNVSTDELNRVVVKQKETEEELTNLIEGVKDYAIFKLNLDGTIASWNEGARTLKGYTKEEAIGKHFSIFYTKEKRDIRFPEYELDQAIKFGRFEDEGLRVKKDGTTFYANVVITALYDKNKNPIGFSKITRDLTERKAFEESLQKMNSELEEKVKLRTEELSKTVKELTKINNDLDNFIYTASHDLKAPVANIEGLIHGLFDEFANKIKDDSSMEAYKNMIDLSIKKFQTTINELTEIAKIQKESSENIEIIDLNEVVEDIKLVVNDFIIKNNASIVCDFNGYEKIKFVRKNIHSIFYNLISNGLKYNRQDRNSIISITGKVEGEFLLFTFKDNGLGVKSENIAKMFTMFKRFHDHVEGSGVGLYIVKRIIENVGGKIEVESKEGEGSIFKIYIPKV